MEVCGQSHTHSQPFATAKGRNELSLLGRAAPKASSTWHLSEEQTMQVRERRP